MIMSSLVPYCPVFDCFTVCKNGGRRPGQFFNRVNDVTVCLGKQKGGWGGGIPDQKNAFCLPFYVLNFVNISVLGKTLQEETLF